MQTHSAALAPWRLTPLHPDYVERARRHAALVRRNGGAIPNYREAMCPYCGGEHCLVATVRVGAKMHFDDIPITPEGYRVPQARGRRTELLVLRCTREECSAVVEPMAYLSPMTFHELKTSLPLGGAQD